MNSTILFSLTVGTIFNGTRLGGDQRKKKASTLLYIQYSVIKSTSSPTPNNHLEELKNQSAICWFSTVSLCLVLPNIQYNNTLFSYNVYNKPKRLIDFWNMFLLRSYELLFFQERKTNNTFDV